MTTIALGEKLGEKGGRSPVLLCAKSPGRKGRPERRGLLRWDTLIKEVLHPGGFGQKGVRGKNV